MTIISLKAFMKIRKPHRFSDSKIVTVGKLNRTLLEYHLESLTSRKQEQEFEEFARKLCQYEICPNLRPQTGSTGGGDSKVDSETIPVASQVRLLFFHGVDSQSKERLAFAFSAKKEWTVKARNDVKEINETGRGYAKVFFVTNQFARDKTRARLEDELSKEYGIDVIILDRTWILDKVFGNKREKFAIEELNLGDDLDEIKEIGPLDFQRNKKLHDANKKIEEDVSNEHITIKTVDDCLHTALLAAELEEPRKDVEGLFDRAIRIAKEYGTDEQYFTAIYQKAWTTFFWFEDFGDFVKLYEEVEKVALDSINIFSIERLNNLWTLLYTLSSTSDLVSKDFIKDKTEILIGKLKTIQESESSSSAAVQAEAILSFINLTLHRDDITEVAKTFRKLKDVLDKANNLIGFPFETTFELLNLLDDIYSGEDSYEDLQEHLVEIVTKREGDISAGVLLHHRGMQHFKAERIYKAIDCLGRALIRFYKKESKDRLVHALFLISAAYEDAGLLWAARGALLSAASLATSDFWLYSKVNTMQIACYERLRSIELQLGRIGYALEWHLLYIGLASQLIETEEEKKELLTKNLNFGSLMGLLIIKTPDNELKQLEKLPDTLMEMDLDFAAFGLIYRLGGNDLLPQSFSNEMSPAEVESFFDSYLSHPAQESLPDKPDYYEDDIIELRSRILGCDFVVKAPNTSPEIEIGEYIVAALESFLSTTLEGLRGISRDRIAVITLKRDEALATELKYEIIRDANLGVSISCGVFNPHHLSKESQENICLKVTDIVLHLIGHTIILKDPEVDLLRLFRDEEVTSRAFNFSTPLVTIGNVLGFNPKRSISQWIEQDKKTYTFSPEKSGKPNKSKEYNNDDKEQSTKNINDLFRHNEVKNVSVIRQHLWDEAGWSGVVYMYSPYNPPVMAFLFKNEDIAQAIFKDWKEIFGNEDKNETIRVSMVRGISVDNPNWYSIVITTDLERLKLPKGTVINVSRVHTLTPDSTKNLDGFVKGFKEFGVYLLAPAIFDETKPYPRVLFDLGIVKRNFIDKQAWEVGPNDLEIGAITEDINPIIPKHVKNPPIAELLKQRASRKK